MIVYILIEDRVNCYGADFTDIVKVFGNYADAIEELEYIKEHPKRHTGINGELVKTFSYIECREAHCDNCYVMHKFENGELNYRIEMQEVL